jgi:signal transduction histidine kinase
MPNTDAGVRRLFELMRRVNSSTDIASVLEEVVHGVVDELGYGVAAIARLEGDTLVMTAVAGPEEVRQEILGRRSPAEQILDEYRQADRWGILRFVPHGRMSQERLRAAWLPDFEPEDTPDAWHPEDALYAPLYSATGELLGNMAVDLPPGNRVPDLAQRELLEMFVVQAGLALSNAQMRERLGEQVRLGDTIKEVAQAGSLIGLDTVLEAAASAITGGLAARQTWITCFQDGDQPHAEHAAGHPRPHPPYDGHSDLRADLDEVTWAPNGTLVVATEDIARGDLLPRSRQAFLDEMAIVGANRSVLAPIAVGGELLGYVGIGFGADHGELQPSVLDAVAEIGRELGRIVHSGRLFETEKRLVSELREIDRYKGELIATISHELKTPLTSIIGHVELLQDIYSEVGSIEAISRNAQRLNRLVNNLLNYSRVQEQRNYLRRSVDLGAICEASVELVAFQAETAGVKIEIVPADEPVAVVGDPDELARVVDNIVGNAVKYTPSGGRVWVRVNRCDGIAEVQVSDTGIGISAQDQMHLFSAFHRSSNPNAQSIPGTGLGLAISRRIIELHAGDITVESELGEGSTFTVRLPAPA